MKHYYFIRNGEVSEVSEDEYASVEGDDSTRDYVADVYHGKTDIDDVPDACREQVAQIVAKRTEMFGEYNQQDISNGEALSIILGGEPT